MFYDFTDLCFHVLLLSLVFQKLILLILPTIECISHMSTWAATGPALRA